MDTARCFDREGDWDARQFFSEEDLQLSPEEYAARNAHRFLNFALHRYRYRDPALGAWVRRFAEVIFNRDELERCRERFLTPEELADVHGVEAESF
jgi:hypothetical protein